MYVCMYACVSVLSMYACMNVYAVSTHMYVSVYLRARNRPRCARVCPLRAAGVDSNHCNDLSALDEIQLQRTTE